MSALRRAPTPSRYPNQYRSSQEHGRIDVETIGPQRRRSRSRSRSPSWHGRVASASRRDSRYPVLSSLWCSLQMEAQRYGIRSSVTLVASCPWQQRGLVSAHHANLPVISRAIYFRPEHGMVCWAWPAVPPGEADAGTQATYLAIAALRRVLDEWLAGVEEWEWDETKGQPDTSI